DHRDLHSFPTRRSSDLRPSVHAQSIGWRSHHGDAFEQSVVAPPDLHDAAVAHHQMQMQLAFSVVALDANDSNDIIFFMEHRSSRSEEHTSELQSLAYLV